MKVLCIGDIMGEPGRRAVARAVPRLVAQRRVDVVIGNGENVAGGFGITPELAEELFDLGLSVITTGNHAWDKKEVLDYFNVLGLPSYVVLMPKQATAASASDTDQAVQSQP